MHSDSDLAFSLCRRTVSVTSGWGEKGPDTENGHSSETTPKNAHAVPAQAGQQSHSWVHALVGAHEEDMRRRNSGSRIAFASSFSAPRNATEPREPFAPMLRQMPRPCRDAYPPTISPG